MRMQNNIQHSIWDDVIPKDELEILNAGGMGMNFSGFGKKCALLVVDMSYGFVDSAYPLGASEVGWPAVQRIQELLGVARKIDVPVFYSTSEWRDNKVERGLWKRTPEVDKRLQHPKTYEIVDELKPLPNEPVLVKFAPSAFHGTNLVNMLVQNQVDTVIVTGMVTSGCVNGTAVDAFSFGFKVIVPHDAVADRSPTCHKVALFNIHMKYGDVMSTKEVKQALLKY